ncbi:hypothetical protein FEI10_12245 [Lacticaseibacillus casei]|nr:hypothetical protein FEI10_12245 [Lacticaseibacillus casei]TLF32416.1 hypothetical protein FEI12_12090 [Lacticaseibacillus casei]
MNGNDQQSGHCRSLDGWWGLVSGGVAVKIGGSLNWEWPRLSETRSQAQKPACKDLGRNGKDRHHGSLAENSPKRAQWLRRIILYVL